LRRFPAAGRAPGDRDVLSSQQSIWKLLGRLGLAPGRQSSESKSSYFMKDEDGNPLWADTNEYGILASEWPVRQVKPVLISS
jgi:hypothetical protein